MAATKSPFLIRRLAITCQDKKSTSSLDHVHHELSPTPEQLDRVAQLVASGEVAFSAGLSAAQTDRLAKIVREHRRRRLVQFIARSIARDICRGVEQANKKESCDAWTVTPT